MKKTIIFALIILFLFLAIFVNGCDGTENIGIAKTQEDVCKNQCQLRSMDFYKFACGPKACTCLCKENGLIQQLYSYG